MHWQLDKWGNSVLSILSKYARMLYWKVKHQKKKTATKQDSLYSPFKMHQTNKMQLFHMWNRTAKIKESKPPHGSGCAETQNQTRSFGSIKFCIWQEASWAACRHPTNSTAKLVCLCMHIWQGRKLRHCSRWPDGLILTCGGSTGIFPLFPLG